MADVNVNIRGRDDGLGSSLDSLREKAQALGRDVSNINQSSLNNMTPTEQRMSVERTSKDTLRAKQDSIKSEYADARKANLDDFRKAESKYASGEMPKREFKEEKQKFTESQEELNKDEDKELISVEKEMNQHLRIIVRELVLQKRLERERAQRDNKEFSNKDEEEKDRKSEKDENGEIRPIVKKDDKDKSDEKNDRSTGAGGSLMAAGTAAAHGNLQGTVSNGIQGGGAMMGLSKAGAGAAAAFLAAYGLLNMGDQVINASGEAGSMRGNGRVGSETMRDYAENVDSDGAIAAVGMKSSDFLGMMKSKAQESGHADNLRDRTSADLYFQRGTGADAGVYSKFERFNEGQEASTQVAMDMLNVLSRIEKSSLKEGDLATLQEKMGIQTNLMDIQRGKRDAVNVDDTLKIMSAFESVGLSQKGEKGGEFLANTISGLGEGGGDNAMLLKYEAMKRAHPEAANDPAKLKRLMKFHNDDPEYMKSAFGFFGDITKGNQMAQDDLMYTMFNPQSEHDMDMWGSAMSGKGSFNNLLTGKPDKQWKGSLTAGQINKDATSASGGLTQIITEFQNAISNIGVSITNFFGDVAGGDKSINVRVKGSLPTYKPQVNTVKKGTK